MLPDIRGTVTDTVPRIISPKGWSCLVLYLIFTTQWINAADGKLIYFFFSENWLGQFMQIVS